MPVQAMVGPRKPGQRKPLLRPAREPATEGCGALETGSTAPFLIRLATRLIDAAAPRCGKRQNIVEHVARQCWRKM